MAIPSLPALPTWSDDTIARIERASKKRACHVGVRKGDTCTSYAVEVLFREMGYVKVDNSFNPWDVDTPR